MASSVSTIILNNSVEIPLPSVKDLGWFQKLNDALNSGDPVVREWFLIKQTFLPFALCLGYALFSTRLGPALMRNRPPFDLRTPMVIFNFAVVTVYVVSLYLALKVMYQLGWDPFCYGSKVEYGTPTYTAGYLAWVVYMLKYFEFLDTVFFVLRKKQNLITPLHVLHHTIVPILGWVLLRMETSGVQAIPAIMNTVVHIIMYSYYGLAAMGPSVRKYLWWKKYLTQLQMVQFVMMTVFIVFVVPMTNCNLRLSSFAMDLAIPPVFLYLFYQYYKKAFKTKEG